MTQIELAAVLKAARRLAQAGGWDEADALLEAAHPADERERGRLATAAADVALERDWFAGTDFAAARLREVPAGWDAEFLRLRRRYRLLLMIDGRPAFGPDGKPRQALDGLRHDARALRDAARGARRGWAEMYLGLVADNLFAERDAAPAHYAEALRAGEAARDDLLAREALRHLGDHHRDDGDHEAAQAAWERATELGARAGAVAGTLSQQLLLATLAQDEGDDAGAARLATEIARWAGALGAEALARQARELVAAAPV
jgi:hypothetical protein